MRGAGIARRGAEVWKCLQRDTTVVSQGEDLLGAVLKHRFLPFLQRSAGPVAFVFLRQLAGHSGLDRCSFEIWKFRFRDGHKTILWFRRKLPRSKAIVPFHIKLALLMVKNLRRCNKRHKSWCRYFQHETPEQAAGIVLSTVNVMTSQHATPQDTTNNFLFHCLDAFITLQ